MKKTTVNIWEREEKDGWSTIMPLTGDRKNDTTMLNPMASDILKHLKNRTPVGQIVHRLHRENPDVSLDTIKADVKAAVLTLREFGIPNLSEKEIIDLFGSNITEVPGLHVMDDTEVMSVSELLQRIHKNEESEQLLYTSQPITEERFKPHVIRAMHFTSTEVFCIHNDLEGKMNGIISVYNVNPFTSVQIIGLLVARQETPDERRLVAADTLLALEDIVTRLTSAIKLRFLIKKSDKSEESNKGNTQLAQASNELKAVIGECGYRREAVLMNEGGPGVHVEFYSKLIGEKSSNGVY